MFPIPKTEILLCKYPTAPVGILYRRLKIFLP
jgi:hypothetical protein